VEPPTSWGTDVWGLLLGLAGLLGPALGIVALWQRRKDRRAGERGRLQAYWMFLDLAAEQLERATRHLDVVRRRPTPDPETVLGAMTLWSAAASELCPCASRVLGSGDLHIVELRTLSEGVQAALRLCAVSREMIETKAPGSIMQLTSGFFLSAEKVLDQARTVRVLAKQAMMEL
jgi:hypothetical protein